MTNTTRRFKIEYTDSRENVQTIAELGQNTGALAIDRFVEIRRKNDPDILKLWLEGSNFGNAIPTRKSEYGKASNDTDEPEIRLKQYNPDTSSFDLVNRFFAKNKGVINEQGELALKLYSFFRYTGRQSVSTGTISDTNGNGSVDTEDALNATLPANGYIVDYPGSETPPTSSKYSLNDTQRSKGYVELTRDFAHALTFTGNLDGNNDVLVKYEPEGFGGTVDTLVSNEQAGSYSILAVDTTNDIFTVSGDVTNLLKVDQAILVVNSTGNNGTYTITNLAFDSGNNETDITVSENVSNSTADGRIVPGGQAVFKSWEKDKTDSIVNKVKVVGTKPSDNTTVTGTATNQTQIDNFGEKFRKVKRGYIDSQSEAETIAESYLVPGFDENGNDITKVPESGTVKTTVYSDNVVNDSFQVVDNTRNIDDTFTVVEQRNFWPEGASELSFEFEQEGLERSAQDQENLRDERSRLYPSSSTSADVGEQSFTGDTGSAPSDTNRDPNTGIDNNTQNTSRDPNTGLQQETQNTSRDPNTGIQEHQNANLDTTDNFDQVFGDTINSSGWSFIVNASNVDTDALFHKVGIIINDITSTSNLDIVITADDETVVAHWTPQQVGSQNHDSLTSSLGDDGYYTNSITVLPNDYTGSTVDYNCYMSTKGSASPDVDVTITAIEINHTHPDDIDVENPAHNHTEDIDVENPDHGHTDDIDTEDFDHGGKGDATGQHGSSGTTDAKSVNINAAQEDKTDR